MPKNRDRFKKASIEANKEKGLITSKVNIPTLHTGTSHIYNGNYELTARLHGCFEGNSKQNLPPYPLTQTSSK